MVSPWPFVCHEKFKPTIDKLNKYPSRGFPDYNMGQSIKEWTK